jgi:antitoxin (DNA-binding transcriptional repressor) of toxin-antitoxin stability system
MRAGRNRFPSTLRGIAVAGSPLSVAKTGERVALIVQANTDTFAGRRRRRRFSLPSKEQTFS